MLDLWNKNCHAMSLNFTTSSANFFHRIATCSNSTCFLSNVKLDLQKRSFPCLVKLTVTSSQGNWKYGEEKFFFLNFFFNLNVKQFKVELPHPIYVCICRISMNFYSDYLALDSYNKDTFKSQFIHSFKIILRLLSH